LLKLPCGHLSSVDGINFLYRMPRRIVLRDNWSHSCDELLRGGLLFCVVGIHVFELSCRIFPSDGRLIQLHIMSRRLVLRYHRFDGCDRLLHSGLLFGCIFNSLLKLSIGNIFIVYIFY